MDRLYFPLVLCLLFFVSISNADMMVMTPAPEARIPTTIVKKQDLQTLQAQDHERLSEFTLNTLSIKLKKHSLRSQSKDWYIDDKDSIDRSLNDLALKKSSPYAGFLSQSSPDYQIKDNLIFLTKVPINRDKESLMFVFLMNRPKVDPNKAIEPVSNRAKMHLLWTGSKRYMIQKKVIKDEYPMDVSIANYEDGFASGEWNFILPNKKPREVKVSLVWSF